MLAESSTSTTTVGSPVRRSDRVTSAIISTTSGDDRQAQGGQQGPIAAAGRAVRGRRSTRPSSVANRANSSVIQGAQDQVESRLQTVPSPAPVAPATSHRSSQLGTAPLIVGVQIARREVFRSTAGPRPGRGSPCSDGFAGRSAAAIASVTGSAPVVNCRGRSAGSTRARSLSEVSTLATNSSSRSGDEPTRTW